MKLNLIQIALMSACPWASMIAFKMIFSVVVFFEGMWLLFRASTNDPIRLPWHMCLIWGRCLRVKCIIMKSAGPFIYLFIYFFPGWEQAWFSASLVLGKPCAVHTSVLEIWSSTGEDANTHQYRLKMFVGKRESGRQCVNGQVERRQFGEKGWVWLCSCWQ